jgi:uncharacterized membrane protein
MTTLCAMTSVGVALSVLANSAYAIEKLECGGTEPFWNAMFESKRVTFAFDVPRKYFAPTYSPALGSGSDYVTSIRAKRGRSQLTAFVVNETRMFVADKNGTPPPDSAGYLAFCSDGMSGLGHHFSIHLIVDGRAYTGCCKTATNPPVGQD